MRTTLTIDDEIAQLLEHESKRIGVSFKEVINTTLRRGIIAAKAPPPVTPKAVVRPFQGGLLPGIDPDRMNQLNDELESEAFLTKPIH